MFSKKTNVKETTFIYFVPIIMVMYLLRMFGFNYVSYLDYLLWSIITVVAIPIAFKYSNKSIVRLVNILVVYCLFSFLAFSFNPLPVISYIYTVFNFVLPISFFYIGYQYSIDASFEKMFLYGVLFCNIVGFFFHITAPPFYTEALVGALSHDMLLNADNVLNKARYGSFFLNSYYICFFCVSALALALYHLNSDWGKKSVKYLFVIISFVAVILCMQRIGIAFALFIPIAYLFSFKERGYKSFFSLIIVFFLIILIGVNYLPEDFMDRSRLLIEDLIERFSFSTAMEERSHQFQGFDRGNVISDIFGLGLGSCGHAARGYGLKTIHDNEFMRLYYELGIIGCFIFYTIVVMSLSKGLKNIRTNFPYITIVGFYITSFIGCEPLDLAYIVTMIFWYAIGRIWNTNYSKNIELVHVRPYKLL